MSGLFGDLDVAGAEELSTGVPAGTYEAVVSAAEIVEGTKNSPDTTFLVLSYQIAGYNFPIREYKSIPKGRPETWDRTVMDTKNRTEADRNNSSRSFLKARFESLGVPVERMNSVEPDDLVGIPVIVTVKKNAEGYSNITKVVQPGASGATLPVAVAPPTPTFSAPVATAGVATVTPIGAAPSAQAVENPFAKK